ncbi:DUF1643 domain-containing protein [Terriglobus sp. ADX1]|uniref:DUF1643 domain-containing protein n=1 Tax=Terriglobus sp. ADX1 TaxID=2794063 RepID=UPI002FE5524B
MPHDPGGKSLFPLPPHVRGSADFDGPNDEYRYRLERVWDQTRPACMFVLMNPSTATPEVDDPTVRNCRLYAERWGFGRLLIGNTFAYRLTDSKLLHKVEKPIGPWNDLYLLNMASDAELIVFAYGKPHRSLQDRGRKVAQMFRDRGHDHKMHVLALCADGTPSHPLYKRADLQPIPWKEFAR